VRRLCAAKFGEQITPRWMSSLAVGVWSVVVVAGISHGTEYLNTRKEGVWAVFGSGVGGRCGMMLELVTFGGVRLSTVPSARYDQG
jgi:hypothetical protein